MLEGTFGPQKYFLLITILYTVDFIFFVAPLLACSQWSL